MRILKDFIYVVMLAGITTALDAYSHRIRNNSMFPIRATYIFSGGIRFVKAPIEVDLAPGAEKSSEGGPARRLAAIHVEYRGSDPRLSGLKARWVPVGSPPLSTIAQIYTDRWPYDPDATTDSVGDPITPPANPKRHTQIHVSAQEFQ